MNLRKALVAAALGGAMGLPGAASAITIAGITFEAGSVFENVSLFEAQRAGTGDGDLIIDNPGEELIGIAKVNQIYNGLTNAEYWSNGDNGTELVVYFYNYIAQTFSTSLDPDDGTNVDRINFSGGVVEIWAQPAGTFNAGTTQAGGLATVNPGNIGTLFLKLEGSNIGNPTLDPATGLPYAGPNITLRSTATGFSGNPFAGGQIAGNGLLDVVGGVAAQYFDTNTFGCADDTRNGCPDIADKSFTSGGGLQPGAGNEWVFTGTGTIRDFAVIPEPGTLALLGAGLMGLGMRRRKVA